MLVAVVMVMVMVAVLPVLVVVGVVLVVRVGMAFPLACCSSTRVLAFLVVCGSRAAADAPQGCRQH